MGECYENGYGVEKDLSRAVEYYIKAHEGGRSDGTFALAACFEKGLGVKADPAKALAYLESASFPIVVKADGLALGKGVLIPQNLQEAEAAVKSIMEDKAFGDSGNEIVIEEFLTGPEVSVLAFTDGTAIAPMVSSMDHKRAGDGDTGPNTGGMGTVAPNQIGRASCRERV